MKYLQGRYVSDKGETSEGFAVHALVESAMEIFTYIQELKTWHRDHRAADHYYFPELHQDKGRISFTEISRDQVYELLPKVPKFDRRDEAQRRLYIRAKGQVRRSGQVLTSAEVGLITKDLKQRVAAGPVIKELIEVRSQHKRWTGMTLYEEDGPARRQAVKSLRENTTLNISAKGLPLDARHRIRRFKIDGVMNRYTIVEVRYVRAADQGLNTTEEEHDD